MEVARYYCRVRNDHWITQFVVENWRGDPRQHVVSVLDDGTFEEWHRHEEGDRLVFTPGDRYEGGGVLWNYDPALQVGQRVPVPMLESELLANRRSAVVAGLKRA